MQLYSRVNCSLIWRYARLNVYYQDDRVHGVYVRNVCINMIHPATIFRTLCFSLINLFNSVCAAVPIVSDPIGIRLQTLTLFIILIY